MSDCLLIDMTAQPVSFLPLSVITWQEAVKYLVSGRASALEWHDKWIVRSANWETQVPAVLMLHEVVRGSQTVAFSKSAVFLRDEWTCQYCQCPVCDVTATMDHVIPQSKGGKTDFENIVTSCFECNSRKGNNHKIVPKQKPHIPTYWELVNKRKKFSFDVKHPGWKNYLETVK